MDQTKPKNLATSMVRWISTQIQRFRFKSALSETKGDICGSRDPITKLRSLDSISKFWDPL